MNCKLYKYSGWWWGHQPGQRAVGGVPTAHNQFSQAILLKKS